MMIGEFGKKVIDAIETEGEMLQIDGMFTTEDVIKILRRIKILVINEVQDDIDEYDRGIVHQYKEK